MPEQKNYFAQQDLDNFKNQGYAFVPGMFGVDEIQHITNWVDEVISWPETKGKHMTYYEEQNGNPDKKILNRIENFIPYHAGLDKLSRTGEVIGRVSELMGASTVLFKDKINLKLPGGRGFTPHQDMAGNWDIYTDYFITALIAVDKNTDENGCLEVSPGDYGRKMLSAQWKPIVGKELEALTWLKIPMNPGDALFFGSYIPHQSQKNNSTAPRRNLYLTYNRLEEGDFREQYYIDKRKSYPPDIEQEEGKTYVFKV
jgi:2-aminoethylphosphonate dioxygenase